MASEESTDLDRVGRLCRVSVVFAAHAAGEGRRGRDPRSQRGPIILGQELIGCALELAFLYQK